jgi:hypothetical protein
MSLQSPVWVAAMCSALTVDRVTGLVTSSGLCKVQEMVAPSVRKANPEIKRRGSCDALSASANKSWCSFPFMSARIFVLVR